VVGIFKANNPFNTFTLFIYGLLLKLVWFLHPIIPLPQKTDGFLFRALLSQLKIAASGSPVIYPVITYILLFTQAVTFNKIMNQQRLMQRTNYLPAMSYLLITSLFAEWNVLSAPLIINTLLIWVWSKMNTLPVSNKPKTTLYNLGVVIGLSTFFYFPSLAFSILIIFALLLTRPFKLSEWVIALVGIITPYYFLVAGLYLSGKLKGYHLQQFDVGYPRFHQNYWALTAIIIVLMAFLTGSYFVQANMRRQVVQVRKSWSLILLYLVVAVFIPFINATHTFEYWILAAVPLSAFIAASFLYPVKRWIPNLLHWSMVGLVVVISYLNNKN
jgi:hypothetical protein